MKTKKQLEYEQIVNDYISNHEEWCAKKLDASSCPYQISDGKVNPDSIRCRKHFHIDGYYHPCTHCNYTDFNMPEPQAPKYKRFISPIPQYCTDCIRKKDCKNIQNGIEWCLYKEIKRGDE